ncbi:hypothetical protein C0J52_15124 [Blattella germanica]|nr:hypothetical protein C0J52_15124 [Blattella germanica]
MSRCEIRAIRFYKLLRSGGHSAGSYEACDENVVVNYMGDSATKRKKLHLRLSDRVDCVAGVTGYLADVRGPRFSLEPPSLLVFSNSSGGRADCAAEGSPEPRVEWVLGSDGSPVGPVPGARSFITVLKIKHSSTPELEVLAHYYGTSYQQLNVTPRVIDMAMASFSQP